MKEVRKRMKKRKKGKSGKTQRRKEWRKVLLTFIFISIQTIIVLMVIDNVTIFFLFTFVFHIYILYIYIHLYGDEFSRSIKGIYRVDMFVYNIFSSKVILKLLQAVFFSHLALFLYCKQASIFKKKIKHT